LYLKNILLLSIATVFIFSNCSTEMEEPNFPKELKWAYSL